MILLYMAKSNNTHVNKLAFRVILELVVILHVNNYFQHQHYSIGSLVTHTAMFIFPSSLS